MNQRIKPVFNAREKEEVKPEPWYTLTTFDDMAIEAVYENVSDYSLGGGYLGMKFKDGSATYLSLELFNLKEINVKTVEV